jgi:glucose uptake protein GlcU
MNEKERHLAEYLIFGVLGVALLIAFIAFRENRNILRVISGLESLLYILWGIIHHSREDRLSKEIVSEYILLGTFVFLLLLTALSI